MAALLTLGSDGQPHARIQQIVVTNGIALLASSCTLPYLAYYLASEPLYYLPIVALNLVFLAAYASVLALDRAGRFDLASGIALATVYMHLILITVLISAGAGVHLFYFTLAAMPCMVVSRRRQLSVVALVLLAIALFLVCHFAFPPSTARVEIPGGVLDAMFAFAATGAIGGSGSLPLLFRIEVDRASAALEASNRELERLSGIDALTGLPNRRSLDDHLAREWNRHRRTGEPLALAMCDVDCFKQYNDHYGHPAGDDCLRAVAGALRDVAGRAGDLVARYGGEEFVIVLPGTDARGAAHLAERARTAIAALELPHERSSVTRRVSLSVGVAATVPDAPDGAGALLRAVDDALYAAKRGGRDRVVAREPEALVPATSA